MQFINILILEDDLETLENIVRTLREIENEKRISIAVTILPDYEKTDVYINKNPQIKFDLLLLDRDCNLGGSFHILDLTNFNKQNIISISSVPRYNDEALAKGARVGILKDYSNIPAFIRKLKEEIILSLFPAD